MPAVSPLEDGTGQTREGGLVTDEEQRLAAIDRELARRGLRIKTHGYRWTIALVYALLHGMRTGHGDGWRLSLGGPDDAPRAYMECPKCGGRVLISTERVPQG
jgi:hypothetical protein